MGRGAADLSALHVRILLEDCCTDAADASVLKQGRTLSLPAPAPLHVLCLRFAFS